MKKTHFLFVMMYCGLLIALPCRASTITTGALSASALCTGSNVKVPFTISGTYNTGNIFTAQLSDANGSFASAVNIGTFSGVTNDTIAGVIPAGTLAGTGYRIRVVANNPGVTGSDNGTNLTIATGASAWAYVGNKGFSGATGDFGQGIIQQGTSQILFGNDGTPYVAYTDDYGNYNYVANVRKFDGTNWVQVGTRGFGMINNFQQLAYYTQLAQAPDGTLYAAYRDESSLALGSGVRAVTVVKFNGTDWVLVGQRGFTTGLAANANWKVNSIPTLSVDANGTPWVAYTEVENTYKRVVAKFNGTNWVTVGVFAGSAITIGENSQVVFDAGGAPYIALNESNNSYRAVVKKFDGTNWVTIGSAGISTGAADYVKLVKDDNGTLYISYVDRGIGEKMCVKKFNGTSWVSVGVNGFSPGKAFSYPSLAIDHNGTPYVGFQDGSLTPLKGTVMKFDGTNWVSVGPFGFTPSNAWPIIVGIGNDNTPYAFFSDLSISGYASVMKFSAVGSVTENTIGTNQSVCSGTSPATITGAAPTGGTGSYTYLWQSSTDNINFTAAPGTNNAQNYSPPAISQPTWFNRLVVSGCSAENSNGIKISINAAVSNNTITTDQSVCAGSVPATLNGSVPSGGDGVNYTYQWQSSTDNTTFNNITGATNSNYSPSAINQATWFRRTVTSGSGSCATLASAAVKISINPAINNNTITADQSICAGSVPATLNGSVPAGGDGVNYTYQWQSSTDNTTFNNITGATNSSYVPSPISQNTWFKRTVVSAGCSNNSAAVAITVTSSVTNNTISSDQAICTGATPVAITGSAPAGGNGSYTYQWQSSTDNINFTSATGTNNGQNYSPAALSQTTWFRRMVTSGNGSCATVFSAAVKITITAAISNNTITADQSVCTGSVPATLNGSNPSGGDGVNYTYQWQSSTDNSTFNNITGATNSNYSPSAINQATWFRRMVASGSGSCAAVVSAAVKISINPALNNNTITADQSICAGSIPATLNGTAPSGGDGANYIYQWQISTDNTNFNNISGANGSNCSPQSIFQTTWYRRVVSSGGCSNTSTAVTVSVTSSVTNNTISSDQSICTGATPLAITGSAPTGGSGSFTYQWQSSTDNTSFTAAAGTNNGQNYSPAALSQTTWFRRMVTSGNGSCATVFSAAVKITINAAISTNTITGDQSICAGSVPATLSGSTPSGGDGVNYTYQWQSSTDNTSYTTATGTNNVQNYSPAVLSQTTWFRRMVTSGNSSCATAVSAAVKISVNPVVSNNTITADQSVCAGSAPAAFGGSVPSGGDGVSYNYQWQSSTDNNTFNTITGATNSGYTPSSISQNTWFKRMVVSGGCSNTSAAVAITVTISVTNNTVSSDQSICTGATPVAITGSAPTGGNGSYMYQWQSSTDNINFTAAAGTNNVQNYSPAALTQTTWFRRMVTSGSGTCATVFSAAVKITINIAVSNNTISPDQSICTGSVPATLIGSAPSGGDGVNYTYQWESSTDNITFNNITGATNSNYSPLSINQSTWFRRMVTSGSGSCASNISTTIKINVSACSEGIVPNVFSPNGDGINDTWVINFLSVYPNCNVTVFTRSGMPVFASTGYPKPWDGNFNNKPIPVATYYYVIDLRNGTIPLSGSVTIIK